ncbi:hypothetical protein GA0070620_0019 [Micromonospora krabiensis]|uniref:Uncharacterized protein n=2 Tax=Micromonospora krabiensis TaxID=307121 RepID=A0A1C3MW96_9ACTN|nr:hypothetical protein GA0070620_0019 [Micromonospora krabiensis]
MLPGYLDGFRPAPDPSTLFDATAWLDKPAVWPALLWAVGGASTAVDAFDIDPADTDVMLTQLSMPDRWPVFTVDLASGHRIHLVWRNFDGDAGWDYMLAGDAFDGPVPLAMLEGHFRGPGLSWPELVVVADQGAATLDWAQRLLLVLPALGDIDLPAEAAEIVAGAITAVGAIRRRQDVAGELLAASRRFWGMQQWADRDGAPTCLGQHSFRGAGASIEHRLAIAAALGEWS